MTTALNRPPVEDLSTWRVRLLTRVLQVMFYAGWLVGVPSVVLAVREQLWPLVAADAVALVWISYLHLARGLSHRNRTLQLLALMYVLSIALLATVGYVSQVYLVGIPVLAVLLLSMPIAALCLGLNGLVLLVAGYALDTDTGMRILDQLPVLRWVAITLNFLLVDAALTAACAFLIKGMEHALHEQQANAEKLAHQAMHDALTGLANRRLLHDRIEHALAKAGSDHAQAAVLLLDLDNFKNVNDRHGHELGDALIVSVGERLQSAVRAGDTVARIGGDEFVVLLPHADAETELLSAVDRVLRSVDGTYTLDPHTHYVSASIGVAVYPRDGLDAATLLKNADTAMYRAKEGGRNRFQFFQAAMNERLVARMELESALRTALERNELVLYYQPRVRAHDGACMGAEALVRWRHPQWGLVQPARFIPVAEDSGLIVPIGAWVLRTAAAQLAQWQLRFPRLRISVNLSAREFRDNALATQVQAAARSVYPGSLEVEVTESLVMQDLDGAQRLLGGVRAQGVGVALDDFGTGFSSLSYLKALPLDVLKIDQSFVRGLEHDPQDRAIVQTIVDLATNLHLSTVAEGVETQAQADVLRAFGVQEFQGFLYAQPLPAADFEAWLQQHCPEATGPQASGVAVAE